jgi:hypothetical protein
MKYPRKHCVAGDESGQAITEYMLMVSVVLMIYLIVAGFISKYGLASKLTTSITQNFAHAYQYGKADALGFNDGGPRDHPRIRATGSFRIFINPAAGK